MGKKTIYIMIKKLHNYSCITSSAALPSHHYHTEQGKL